MARVKTAKAAKSAKAQAVKNAKAARPARPTRRPGQRSQAREAGGSRKPARPAISARAARGREAGGEGLEPSTPVRVSQPVDYGRADELLEDPHDDPAAEPDRGAALELRAVPADGPARRGAEEQGPAGRLLQRLPVRGLPLLVRASLRPLRTRDLGVQVRRPEGAGAPAHRLRALRHAHQGGGDPRDRRGLPLLRPGDAERGAPLPDLRQPGGPSPHLHRERLPGARPDLRGTAQGDVPARALRTGQRAASGRCGT